MIRLTRQEILQYHLGGKLGVRMLRDLQTQRDLSIAYTPGVGEACLEISRERDHVYRYTCKANSVAVVTDGSAVLGLGDLGPEASIPVMEGKAVLFKAFADIDAWPVPLDGVREQGKKGKTNVDKVVATTAAIAPMYGGINLEDFAAPACFEIERQLDELLDIPVFHDDQWGTAIITLAAVINYGHLSGKELSDLSIVINGAGAAGIRIAEMLKASGVRQVIMADSRGILRTAREDLNEYKRPHAVETTKRNLAEALAGSDVFVGVSVKDCVTREMVKSMNDFPGIFAMANPNPEIQPEQVVEAMGDRPFVMATGRSDYPNQINNVLGFPHIFRGAMDVQAKTISMNMKIAAAKALGEIPRKGAVEKALCRSYNRDHFEFGPDYLVPLPMDKRVGVEEASAVARAALEEGNSGVVRSIAKEQVFVPAGESDLSGLCLTGFAYHQGSAFAKTLVDGEPRYIPLGEKVRFELQDNADISVALDERPGQFFRRAFARTGMQKASDGSRTCLDDSGHVVDLSESCGWTWNSSRQEPVEIVK